MTRASRSLRLLFFAFYFAFAFAFGLSSRLAVEHRAATALRTAAAGVQRELCRIVGGFPRELIVVPQLFARLDGADRIDEHATALDHRLAIRIAAVIDEARIVAADTGIDDGARACDEQERVPVVVALLLVAVDRLRRA